MRERQNDGNGDEGSIGRAVGEVPKMPYSDEERDFMDSYLGRFERFAERPRSGSMSISISEYKVSISIIRRTIC